MIEEVNSVTQSWRNTSWSGRSPFGALHNGSEGGSFRRIKNKEQGSQFGPRVGLAAGGWLNGYTVFPDKWGVYGDMKVICILVCWYGTVGRSGSIWGQEISFSRAPVDSHCLGCQSCPVLHGSGMNARSILIACVALLGSEARHVSDVESGTSAGVWPLAQYLTLSHVLL